MTRASIPSSPSVSRPRSLWTTTRSNFASRRRHRSWRDAVRRGQQVMRREDRRRAKAQPDIGLGEREPLQVQHVRCRAAEAPQHVEMLHAFQRQPQPRAPEEPRRQRIERLAAPVPDGRRDRAEAKVRGRHLHIGARAGERGRELVVVPGREGRRIGEQDAHVSSVDRCSSAPGTCTTATARRRSGTRSSTR